MHFRVSGWVVAPFYAHGAITHSGPSIAGGEEGKKDTCASLHASLFARLLRPFGLLVGKEHRLPEDVDLFFPGLKLLLCFPTSIVHVWSCV